MAKIFKMNKDDKTSYLIPPEGDDDVGKKVFSLLAKVIEHRKATGLHARWLRNYEMIRNKHWKREPAVKVPLATANFCFTHFQRTCNTLTDNNPIFNVAKVPNQSPEEEEKCELLQHAADHWWIEQEQQDEFESSVRGGETYGCAIEKVHFDMEAGEFGMGEVQTIVIDPFSFGIFPTNIANPKHIEKAYAIFYFYPMSVTEAKQKWPDFADEIKPDSEALKDLGDERKKIASGGSEKGEGFMISIANTVKEVLNYVSPPTEDTEQLLIVEAWIKDKTTVEKKIMGMSDDGVEVELGSETKPKYTGEVRYIVSCNSGKITLEDRDNPNVNPTLPPELAKLTYLYNRRPFCMVNSIRDTTSCFGFSDLEQIEQLQMEVDKAVSQFILLKDRASRRKIKNPRTSGVDNAAFTNTVGIINPVNSNEAGAITYMEEPQLPVDVVNAITMFKDLMLFIAGTFDLDQAMAKGNNRLAYKALQALLERAGTMQRGKIRSYSRLIRERGRMYISCLQNFYTEERNISFTDKSGDKVVKPIMGKNLVIPAKLTVVDGSTMPISRVQQREEAIALRQMGVYDDEELLRYLDSPGRQELMKRKTAGMLQPIMQKLQSVGVPPQLIQYLGAIAQMDEKKLGPAVKNEEIPTFPQIFQNMVQQGAGQPNPEQVLEQKDKEADLIKKQQEIEKLEAEKMLTIERITTERVSQEVKLFGIQYDAALLETQRMKIRAELHKAELDHHAKIEGVQARKAGTGVSPYGGKSDNRSK